MKFNNSFTSDTLSAYVCCKQTTSTKTLKHFKTHNNMNINIDVQGLTSR